MIAKVERNFHPGIPATHNENFLPFKPLAGFIIGNMQDLAGKFVETLDFRHDTLCILAGGDDKPPANVLNLAGAGLGFDSPKAAGFIVASQLNALIELWLDFEFLCVAFEVLNELFLRRVFWEFFRKWKARELAKLLWKMKLKPIVSSFLPQRSYAVGSFDDHKRNALFSQTRRRRQSRRSSADDHRTVNPNAPLLREQIAFMIDRMKQNELIHFLFPSLKNVFVLWIWKKGMKN